MSKKKTNDLVIKATAPVAANKAPKRKPKAKATLDTQLKKTILSAPRSVKLEAANSFMRTTAFTLQEKVRTAMTELSKIDKPKKTPSARLGLSFDSSVQPTSSESFFSKPFNRFKIAFVTVVIIGGISGYFYSDRVIDGFKNLGDTVSSASETHGTPEGDMQEGTLLPQRMMEETVVPVAEEVPAATAEKNTDVLPTEPMPAPAAEIAPAPVPAPKVKDIKASKPSKAARKNKVSKGQQAKPKAKSKTKSSAK